MGRSNWLFAGSLAAGVRAAQIMSLLETAKMNGLEPHAWLTDVLTRLPECPKERLAELLPLEEFTFSGPGTPAVRCSRAGPEPAVVC
ncbi:hypothetical protein LEJE111609_20200 [Lelliottia jeotgali]